EDLRELPDRELLSAHCTGDPDAFGELFRRHRDQMWALALRTTHDAELAADAVQEAFISAFRDADMSVLADTHDHHHSVDVRLDIRAALEQLPEGQLMALTLVDMHGLKIAEAASILNVAEGTVKSRCARGRAAMAPLLGLAPAFETSIAPARKEPNASP